MPHASLALLQDAIQQQLNTYVNFDYLLFYPVPEHEKCEISAHLQRQRLNNIREDYTTSFTFFMNRFTYCCRKTVYVLA